MNRTKMLSLRVQPKHHKQILKAAREKRNGIETAELIQRHAKAVLIYTKFFDEMQDILMDKDLLHVVSERKFLREIMIKQIEKLIIERGV